MGEKPSVLRSASIGVVKVEGVIYDAEPILKTLKKYEKESYIKAVVVRVNSPGGAVGPSQEIYQALKKLQKTKKVVASMGTIAASGGYYVSLGAQKIMASPGTLTGSIGVVMEFAHLQELFKWAKIDHTVITSGRYKDIGSPFRPMRPDEKKLLDELIQNVYAQFRGTVLSERNLRPDVIEMATDGRVFTGAQAKEWGLIDDIGTFDDAVQLAQPLAKLEGEPNLVYPEKEKKFMKLIFGEAANRWMDYTTQKQVLLSPLLYLMPI